MFDLKTIHISLELWGSILCLIAALCTFLNGFGQKQQRKIMTLMQLCAAALLISDTLAWIYRGNGTSVGYYMVRISNAAVFILSFVILGLFTHYVYSCIKNAGSRQEYAGISSMLSAQ